MPSTSPKARPQDTVDGPDSSELRVRLDEAERRTLEYWVEAVTLSGAGSMTVKSLQQTVSWRVTRPLRAVKIVSTKLRTAGPRKTVELVRSRLAQIRQARKRG